MDKLTHVQDQLIETLVTRNLTLFHDKCDWYSTVYYDSELRIAVSPRVFNSLQNKGYLYRSNQKNCDNIIKYEYLPTDKARRYIAEKAAG